MVSLDLVFEYILLGFGALIGSFIVLWIIQTYEQAAVTNNIKETTALATQSIQAMFSEYVNAMQAMHGVDNITAHAKQSSTVNKEQTKQ